MPTLKISILFFFLCLSVFCKGQTISNVSLGKNGMLYYSASYTNNLNSMSIQKKINGNWVNVRGVSNSFISKVDDVNVFNIKDSIPVPLDSGSNYFRIVLGSQISDEVSLTTTKGNRVKVILGPENKIVWNDMGYSSNPQERQIISSGKLIRFSFNVWYSIRDKDGTLMKEGNGKFIDFSTYKKGNYFLDLGGAFYVFENK